MEAHQFHGDTSAPSAKATSPKEQTVARPYVEFSPDDLYCGQEGPVDYHLNMEGTQALRSAKTVRLEQAGALIQGHRSFPTFQCAAPANLLILNTGDRAHRNLVRHGPEPLDHRFESFSTAAEVSFVEV